MHSTRRQFLARTGATLAGFAATPLLLRARTPAARAQEIPGAITFKGASGVSFVGPVTLNAALTVVRAQHNGTGNFVVNLFAPGDGLSAMDAFNQADTLDDALVYDVVRAYKGGSALITAYNADYYVYVNASAAWQISVEQPLPETVTAAQGTSFSSKGQDITPYFYLPDGISQIAMQVPSGASLTGTLFHLDDLGGEVVQAGFMGHYGQIFDFLSPDNQPAYPLTPPDSGPYLFFANNDVTDTTPWTVTFS